MWHAGSDVMGCRRPTGGVFTYVSSDRVTLRAFPVATPRGRSSSSHEGEHDATYQIVLPIIHLYCFKGKGRFRVTWGLVWTLKKASTHTNKMLVAQSFFAIDLC